MANISDAFGRLTVSAKDEQTVDAIAELISTAGDDGEYWTVFHGETEREEDVEVGGAEKTYHFTGCGRGTYLWNLEHFVEHLKHWCEKHSEYEVDGKKIREIWEKIKDEKWQLLFDYTDEEGGCGYLVELVVLVSSDGKTAILREEEWDYTPENLVALGVYDSIEDAREELDWV